MKFKHYNPEIIIPALRKLRVESFYEVCRGCVFTDISPEYCYRNPREFKVNSVQSDMFCPHCTAVIEADNERFELSADPNLEKKVEELREILRLAFQKKD